MVPAVNSISAAAMKFLDFRTPHSSLPRECPSVKSGRVVVINKRVTLRAGGVDFLAERNHEDRDRRSSRGTKCYASLMKDNRSRQATARPRARPLRSDESNSCRSVWSSEHPHRNSNSSERVTDCLATQFISDVHDSVREWFRSNRS